MKQSRDREQHRLLSHIYYFACGRHVFSEVITSLQIHTFRQRLSPFAASVNQRCISWLLHCSRWIPSTASSLAVTPRLDPNLNIWNQSWVRSLAATEAMFTHFMRISKVWFPLGYAPLQAASLTFCNRCLTLQPLYQKKAKLFFSPYCFAKIGLVQKFLVNERKGKGSADRACSVCLIF